MKNFLCIMRRMLILVCLFAMTSGCGAANTVFDSGISQTDSKTKGEEDMEKTEMTALEVELFARSIRIQIVFVKASFSITRKRRSDSCAQVWRI